MTTSILVLKIGKKRELLRARQLTRQIAGLLGFNANEQASIAAAVFELGCQTLAVKEIATLQFQITESLFQVLPGNKTPPLRLEKPLPRYESTPAAVDLVWMVRQLAELTPFQALEEIQRQNQELLRTLAELKACQAKLEQMTPPQTESSAA